MAKKCNGCGRFTNTSEGVKCTKCSCYYHRGCVNIPADAAVAPTWLCPGCKVQTPRKDNTENPVRGEKADYVDKSQQSCSACGTCAELLKEMKRINENTTVIKNDFKTMKEDVSVLRVTVEKFGARLDGIETRLERLEIECAEMQSERAAQPGPEVTSLLTTIEDLKAQLNDREQEAVCNDFEISGIPEEQGENAAHIVGRIAEKLGVAYEERDLVLVERTGARRVPSAGEPAPRPRPLAVRLARRSVRAAFLQAARVRRTLTTEGLGLASAPTKIYLNERLSRHNKMLFFKAREEARAKGWKYAWTRDGRIFVRREMGKAAFRVRSMLDLEKIFGATSGAAAAVVQMVSAVADVS